MAKATKKISKVLKSVKTKVSEVVKQPAPPIDPGMVNIAIAEADLVTFVNLMAVCARTFSELALKAADDNDTERFRILQARYQLTSTFSAMLSDCVKMPEPVSRELH